MHNTQTRKKLNLQRTTIRRLSDNVMLRVIGAQAKPPQVVEGDTGERNLICLQPSIKQPCSYAVDCY